MSLKVTVIANSVARKNVDRIVSLIEEAAPESTDLTVVKTTGPNTATALTRSHLKATDMFIAIGGDGTVSEVVSGLHGSTVPLAIIPAGSTNIIAREHAIPTSPVKAVALAFGNHQLENLDLGYCNNRPFIHMAGMGFDSYMFEYSNANLKRKLGWAAYFPAAGRALMRGSQHYSIRADGEQFECVSPLILVANGRCVLSPKVKLHPRISFNDGYLDLLVFEANTPLTLLRTISRFAGQSLEKSPFVTHLRVQRAEIESEESVPVEADGDVITTTPVTFTIKQQSVAIVTPGK